MSTRPSCIAQHLEPLGRDVDLDVANAQLVRAEAAADIERPAAVVFEVQRLDGDAIARESCTRGPRVLVARLRSPPRGTPRSAISIAPAKCGSRLVPITFDVRPGCSPRHVADDVGDALDEAEADGARLDREFDRLLRETRG